MKLADSSKDQILPFYSLLLDTCKFGQINAAVHHVGCYWSISVYCPSCSDLCHQPACSLISFSQLNYLHSSMEMTKSCSRVQPTAVLKDSFQHL